jgi:hypothetical protein
MEDHVDVVKVLFLVVCESVGLQVLLFTSD